MECKNTKNRASCPCTYEPCNHKGACCICIQYHKRNREIPGCLFPADMEKTYDRSFEAFATWVYKDKKRD